MSHGCRPFLPFLEVFGDGELSADKVLEVEQHLAECRLCRERVRLNAALRVSTRQALRGAAAPSSAFQARVAQAMAAERERQEQRVLPQEMPDRQRARWLPWHATAPIAAAAALTLLWARSNHQSEGDHSRASDPPREALAGVTTSPATESVDRLIDEFLKNHASPPAPELLEPARIPELELQVGVPVPRPSLDQYGAHWEGANLVAVPVQNHRAASLRYRVAGHRVTLYVYNADRFPLRATLEPRVVRNQAVFIGTRRGYTLAAIERRGVGYAVTTDLSDRESAELIAATIH